MATTASAFAALAAVNSSLAEWRTQGKVRRLWGRDASIWTGRDEAEWLGWLGITNDQLAHIGRHRVDPIVASFEAIARNDSTIKVEAAAQLLGLSPRQLERRCLAGFGLSPKAVLQRCRFLDMATAMRGFSNADEAELAALRFFDQSHLNREFRRYTGMTPGAFQRLRSPLFDASLQLRESGKALA